MRRHALEEHVPALQGPFSWVSAEGEAESLLHFAQSDNTAVDLCTLRCALGARMWSSGWSPLRSVDGNSSKAEMY